MKTLELICRLPGHLKNIQTKSPAQLVKESGYVHDERMLDIKEIQNYIRSHPELLEEWTNYSGDKRSSNGWYFEIDDSVNLAEVGYYPKGEIFKFSDKFKACAKFIQLEITEISLHAG